VERRLRVDASLEKAPVRFKNETVLIQLDEVVHMLAERGVADPRAALDAILSL